MATLESRLLTALNTGAAEAKRPRTRTAADRLAFAAEQEANPSGSLRSDFPPDTLDTEGLERSEGTVGYIPYREGMVIRAGMHLELPLSMLKEHPNNPRTFYTDEALDEMVRSLQRDGQMLAIQVYPPEAPGEPCPIKEGHTRWHASGVLRWATVRVDVLPPPTDALLEFRQAREVNKRRRNLTVFDDALRFKQILEEHSLKVKDLEVFLDEKPPYISKTQTIVELPRDLIDRMQENRGLFGLTMAYNVALYFKRFGLEKTGIVIDRICAGELTSRQLERMVSRKQPDTEPAQDGVELGQSPDGGEIRRSRPVRLAQVKGGGKGELKLFPKGRLELKVVLANIEHEQVLFEQLREVFLQHGLTFGDESTK